MKTLFSLMVAALISFSSSAFAITEQEGAALAECTVLLTALSAGDDFKQIVLHAQEDAANFIMSEGKDAKSAQLKKAFDLVRSSNPNLKVSDLELAQAILDL
ncbi:DUF2388 domain-containing protein [Bdellovibrio reynosensis]|uniref:DUF2388 domain-containing protein n=1 Tax=Bdellovibrio reynosensis TaxID=2835041 RepID=A0ABY4CBF9_9BACT|nr:DUF2388 domain-containing protein [Bdellovibrio reynosensis]UOF02119.1 DUF2388 domain-containing protein [Bdellovibrio reynosensis]